MEIIQKIDKHTKRLYLIRELANTLLERMVKAIRGLALQDIEKNQSYNTKNDQL